jgi:plasmid stabilization system protein ParE
VAEIVWAEPALADLDAIADYIAIENPAAASALVDHPASGSRPQEFPRTTRYRQLVEPPCRIFYRQDGARAIIVQVMRSERKLRASRLAGRKRPR